ncbi:hypothetical protein [Nocardioides massiliensis]|uniref:Membrane protein n=1 Tax=Nocardioides massiliensis TaxID=1325935 RepID=A0ABT9NRM5_9ACTN|nr:hypothetical protein [Nocardioides massiliensis]MDP9822932.1 putative membrane protein [Nocardioides massiliensis]
MKSKALRLILAYLAVIVGLFLVAGLSGLGVGPLEFGILALIAIAVGVLVTRRIAGSSQTGASSGGTAHGVGAKSDPRVKS